jgi:UDP-N-acetylglucosamine 4,6-dehydratase/5-epimerase
MKVLITGGTGYLGQALTRHLLQLPDTTGIRIYSRGEAAQARMASEIHDDRMRYLVGDVRDRDRLERAMEGCDAVIHTAALKRVEVGERDPSEMVKTNVLGTMNAIEAARAAGVTRMVVLSSDKACAPLNAYGASKLMAEKLALAAGQESTKGPTIAVTRYGNVAGSTGSIIPTWRAAIANEQAICLTDPNATRFWMTVEDACDLVVAAMHYRWAGCLLVPSLPAYEVRDLLVAMRPPPYEVRTIGLGTGEKLHEEMISEQEARGFTRIAGMWVKGANYKAAEERQGAMSSERARRMTTTELVEALRRIK